MAVSQSSVFSESARGDAALSQINITPLIDVMLVLLIIFMVISPVVGLNLDARLPQANREATAPTVPPLQLVAQADGRYRLDGVVHGLDTLRSALVQSAANDPERVLMVSASADADYQAFANALATAEASGIRQIAHGQ
ncbi:ExbD/TolR family protein [Marilutibacter aestuarii]|uniref:Biopolymer transporter ExbD n=1 Tax=Marilutibacter aestuarii TaxID=1706195 RepID=A0A507ZUJ2_9GAMM|nr:biopolymer transporter ExbD [Lysobacter aestuarii]TQD39914.1 biopolymer transporter ExbD [Lysobacter aestuarii]